MPAKPACIVLGVTKNWAFAAANVLMAVREESDLRDVSFVVFHDGLEHIQQRLLQRIAPVELRRFDIDLGNPTRFRVSKLGFSRYECLRMLDQFRRVVWIDADTLVKGDIQCLVDMPIRGIGMYLHAGVPISVSFSRPIESFDMQRACFNTGIFVVDDTLRDYRELCEWCYQKTNDWSNAISSDQAIINLMLQHYELEVTQIDQRFNCEPARENDATVIVHPWGPKKLWHHPVHPLWFRNYRRWRLMGGDGPKVVPPPRRLGRVRNLLDTGICRFRRALAYAGV